MGQIRYAQPTGETKPATLPSLKATRRIPSVNLACRTGLDYTQPMFKERLSSLLVKDKDSASWIKKAWDTLAVLPGGSKVYSRFIGQAIPYTGSMSADVLDLQPGFALVQLADRPKVRNHLNSVHAIALSNLAELTGNAALACSIPEDARFIVTRLDMRYLKKARGTITASCHCPPNLSNERRELELQVELRDEAGDAVARATLYSLVGPTKKAQTTKAQQ